MDPWDSYEEYFYFKAPVKMNITITVTMKGTQGVSVSLYNSRGNYLMDSNLKIRIVQFCGVLVMQENIIFV